MSGIRKNRDILTGGKKYAQKQAKKHHVEEVVFDKDLRVEYLTGFHKRKLERKKRAQSYIKEQGRLTRIEERKQMRDDRKTDMENQLKEFNETMKNITNLDNSDNEEWEGFDKDGEEEEDKDDVPATGELRHTEVYTKAPDAQEISAIIEDETTVTVESLDNPAIASAKEAAAEAIARANSINKAKEDASKGGNRKSKLSTTVGIGKPEPKKKKKSFRYLSKAERRDNLRKEKSKSFKYKKD